MPFQVFLTNDAARDLEESHDYIGSHDEPGKADRIIYRVMAENAHVLVIADGRRDMQALLQRRLLQALPINLILPPVPLFRNQWPEGTDGHESSTTF